MCSEELAAAAKSRQSCPTLCDPRDGSPPGSPSLGFSRQEHWSGVPFPSPMHESESGVAQSCPTLRDPVDCSLPGSSVHGIFQARVLEWGAIAFLALPKLVWPLSLVPGRKHLNPWNVPSDGSVFVILGGPLSSCLIVYANEMTQAK